MVAKFRANKVVESSISPTIKQDFPDGTKFKIEKESLSVTPIYNQIDPIGKLAIVGLAWAFVLRPYIVYSNCFQYNIVMDDFDNSEEQIGAIIVDSMAQFLFEFQKVVPNLPLVDQLPEFDKEKIENLRDSIISRLKAGK